MSTKGKRKHVSGISKKKKKQKIKPVKKKKQTTKPSKKKKPAPTLTYGAPVFLLAEGAGPPRTL